MNTTYYVETPAGEIIGIFPKAPGILAAVRELVEANPGATVRIDVAVTNPCGAHHAYEAGNCPVCGTSPWIAS